MNKILDYLSIEISSGILEETYQKNSSNIIVLHRHKIFLITPFLLKFLSSIFFITYIIVLLSYNSESKMLIEYILSIIGVIIFILRLFSGILLYHNSLKYRKTVYYNDEVRELFNCSYIRTYISKGITLSLFLFLDIFLSIVIQISNDDNIIENIWLYFLELVLFIGIIWLKFKSMRILFDFEMDYVIFVNGTVKLVDREGFYKKSVKVYTSNQIQTITVKQIGWIDSLLKIGSIEIHTSNQNSMFGDKILTFGKIDYNNSMEDKFHNIIYKENQIT